MKAEKLKQKVRPQEKSSQSKEPAKIVLKVYFYALTMMSCAVRRESCLGLLLLVTPVFNLMNLTR